MVSGTTRASEVKTDFTAPPWHRATSFRLVGGRARHTRGASTIRFSGIVKPGTCPAGRPVRRALLAVPCVRASGTGRSSTSGLAMQAFSRSAPVGEPYGPGQAAGRPQDAASDGQPRWAVGDGGRVVQTGPTRPGPLGTRQPPSSCFRLQTSGFRLQISDFRLQTSDFRLQTSDFRLRTSDFGLQTSDFRLQISGFRLQTSGFRRQTSDVRLQASDFRFQISDFRLQTSDFRLQASGFRFQTSDFRLQISDFRLPPSGFAFGNSCCS